MYYMRSGEDHSTGDFFFNNKQGRGEELFASGRRYIGQYDTDLPHGFGILYNPDGSVVHLGQWCKGKAVIRHVERATEIDCFDKERADLLASSFEKRPSLLPTSIDVPSLSSVDELEPSISSQASRSSLGSSVDGQVSFYDARNSRIAPKSAHSNAAHNIPIASDICYSGDILELSKSSTGTSVGNLEDQVSVYATVRH
jgi:hypothetical protein